VIHEFHMGATQNEQLTIAVLGRAYPNATDFWDANWVTATISIAVGAFSGRVEASLRIEEFRRFNEGLKRVNRVLSGLAELKSMEDWIVLTVKAESRGHITIFGEVSDYPGMGNTLRFELSEVDQTYLSGWIKDLDEIEQAFPLIGRP
jgi:hypothetical protein